MEDTSVPTLQRTQTHAATWALTLRSEEQREILMNYTTECQAVERCLIGPEEVSPEGEKHRHALITFKVLKPRTWVGIFGTELRNMWIRALRPYHGETQRKATANYARYCVKEGPAIFELNIPREWTGRINTEDRIHMDNNIEEADEEAVQIPAKKRTKTTDIIRDRIEGGGNSKRPLSRFSWMRKNHQRFNAIAQNSLQRNLLFVHMGSHGSG